MLSEIGYLWNVREKPLTLARGLKLWAKRILTFPGLIRLLLRAEMLRLRGASVGRLTAIGEARFEGDIRKLKIGDCVSVGRCVFHLHDNIFIGHNAVVSDGVVIMTASHSLSDPEWGTITAPIEIGDHAWVATNATILPGVSIGRGAVVGAASVIRSNVTDYALAFGDPQLQKDNKRARNLNYSPSFRNAPYEAWVGRRIRFNDFDV